MSDLPVVNAVDELKEQVTLDRQALQKSLTAGLLNVVKSINSLHDSFNAAFDVQKRMLDAQEAAAIAMREKELEDARKKKDEKVDGNIFKESLKGTGFLGIIVAIGAAVTGFLVGVLDGLKDLFKLITPKSLRTRFNTKVIKPITMFFNSIGDIFSKAGTGKILKGDTFKVFGRFTQSISKFAEKLKKPVEIFSKATDKISEFFSRLGRRIKVTIRVIEPLRDQFNNLSKLGEIIKGAFGNSKEASGIFSSLGKVIKPFFDVFRRLGRFLGGPITAAIFAIVDGIFGAFKGFKETSGSLPAKLLGAISGFIAGVISGFVGGLADLAKGIVGFIAGLFGLDGVKEALASFSFKEMLFDGIMFPFRALLSFFDGEDGNIFSGITDGVIDGIKSIFSSIAGFVKQKFKAIGNKIAGFFGVGGDEEPEAPRSLRRQQAEESKAKLRARAAAGDPNVKVTTSRGGQVEGLSDEEYFKERNEKLKKNLAALSAREAEENKKIAESAAKMRALGYDPSKGLGELDRDDENQMAALEERKKILRAKAKLRDITTEKTLSQDELDFIKDTSPGKGSQAQNNVNSNVNNVTTNNTSSMNKTTAMPANAGRQGGAQYKTASGFG